MMVPVDLNRPKPPFARSDMTPQNIRGHRRFTST